MEIKEIYLDMDGVLCDFETAAVENGILDPETNKLDIPKLKEAGEAFWVKLKPITEGMKVYDFLFKFCMEHEIDLCILSAIFMTSGKEGKKKWIKNHIKINPMNIFIVNKGADKVGYANENSILIDDYSKNCREFISGGGHAIQFKKNGDDVIKRIKEIVAEG